MITDLPAPAQRLYDLLLSQAAANGAFELRESWVLQEMGCGSKRLREYRGRLVAAGLVAVRRFGPLLVGALLPAQPPAPERVAESATRETALPLFADDRVAESATLDNSTRGRKCHASEDDRAKSATLDNSTRGTFCHASARKVPRVAKSATRAREKCHASGRKVGRLINPLINNLPTPLPPTRGTFRAPLVDESAPLVDESAPPSVVWQVAPASPDYARNRDLLEDPELSLEDGPSIDFLARNYAFDALLRQVFAHLRARDRSALGPGALVHRCKRHLADPRLFLAAPLSRAEQQSDLYRRHVQIVAEAADRACAEPAPQPEPEPQPAPDAREWQIAKAHLRLQLPQSTYDTWVHDTRGAFVADGAGRRLIVYVANRQAVEWLRLRLLRRIESTLVSILGERVAVEFVEVAEQVTV